MHTQASGFTHRQRRRDQLRFAQVHRRICAYPAQVLMILGFKFRRSCARVRAGRPRLALLAAIREMTLGFLVAVDIVRVPLLISQGFHTRAVTEQRLCPKVWSNKLGVVCGVKRHRGLAAEELALFLV